MVVSHDRTFLDAVCSDTLHISGPRAASRRSVVIQRGQNVA